MDIITQSVFIQGSQHQVCEDYATSFAHLSFGAATLSDGCSSAPGTDVGARFLALHALNRLLEYDESDPDIPEFHQNVLNDCLETLDSFILPEDRLLATLLWMTYRDSKFIMSGVGDGALMRLKHTPEGVKVALTVWDEPSNTPPYLVYRKDRITQEFFDIAHHLYKEEAVFLATQEEVSFSDKKRVKEPHVVWSHDEYEAGILLSDGVLSFLDGRNRLGEQGLIAFARKLALQWDQTGHFIYAVTKVAKDMGFPHYDDLSASGIWVSK